MKAWKYLDTGVASAEQNMAVDRRLLQELHPEDSPLLHVYEWSHLSATYGHFVRPLDFLDSEGILKMNLPIAKRPTGGGILFHGLDLTFSLLIPASNSCFSRNTLANYAFVNAVVMNVIKFFLGNHFPLRLFCGENNPLDSSCSRFCMANPTEFDVMVGERKVCGGAQRQTRKGFLHQASICLTLPSEDFLAAVLKPKSPVLEKMRFHSYPLLGADKSREEMAAARKELYALLLKAFSRID